MPVRRIFFTRCPQLSALIVAAMVFAGLSTTAQTQEGRRLLPFGGINRTAEPVPEIADARPVDSQPSFAEGQDSEDDGFWPNVQLPQLQWRPLWSRPGDPQQGLLNRPVNRIRTAGRNTVQATRNAWNATVNKFSWGGTTARQEQYARRQEQLREQQTAANEPGFWDRLFGSESESEGPQTVVEWMAQDRPGMSKR